MPAALHRRLTGLAEREGASLFMVLHAAVSALLTRCGAGEDIVVGVPVAGRSEPGLDDLIGLITNTLVLRADTSGDPAFRELLARVRPGDLAALDHQELPFDRLVDDLNPPRLPGRHPLFQVMLALQNNEPALLRLDGRAVPLRPSATGTAKFDLFVDVLERHTADGTPDGLDLHVEYATDLYDTATAEEFARALGRLLTAVSADPDTRLRRLPAPEQRTPAADREPDTAALTEAALSVPGVRDAAVLPAAAGDAPRLFVVPGRVEATEGVERLLERTGRAAVRVTAVSTLPRTADGDLDTAALAVLPAVDRSAAQDWQRHLARADGVARAEATVEHTQEELARRYAGPPRRTTEPAPTVAPEAADRRPALSEGPELTEPSVPGWSEALVRAAEHARGDIVHVRADGSETRRAYASLIPEASRVLAGLRRAGLRPGDRVILQCDDSEDFLAALWGCVLGGFVAVPLTVPASYGTSSAALTKLEGIWRMLGRPWMVCSPALEAGLRGVADRLNWPGLRLTTADALREAPEDRDWYAAKPDDLILMLMTSGSTGLPKAVRLTHRNVLTRSAATEAVNGLGARDVTLNWIPLDHVTGVVMFHLRDLYLGCRQIHAPTSWILQDPTRWMDLAHRHRVTVTWAPNFAFGLLAEQADRFRDRDWDLSPMRLVMNAGEVVVAAAARGFLHALRPFGLPQDVMHPGWGMSETCSVVTDSVLPAEPSGADETFVSCGLPYPGFAMRVLGEDAAVLAEGDVGRLQVRGTSVTGGYHDNPAANAEAFTDDGWFDTGDLAFLRDGELFITGRAKDVIIVNGVNHYSHEIESCVEELPVVVRSFTAACAVRTDPAAGTDELALFVHLADGPDRAAALREIAGKVTREIGVSPAFLVPVGPGDIPKTEIGKIQRTRLRKSFEAGDFDDAVRAAQLLMGTAATLPDWFLRSEWRPAAPQPPRPLPPRPAHPRAGRLRHRDPRRRRAPGPGPARRRRPLHRGHARLVVHAPRRRALPHQARRGERPRGAAAGPRRRRATGRRRGPPHRPRPRRGRPGRVERPRAARPRPRPRHPARGSAARDLRRPGSDRRRSPLPGTGDGRRRPQVAARGGPGAALRAPGRRARHRPRTVRPGGGRTAAGGRRGGPPRRTAPRPPTGRAAGGTGPRGAARHRGIPPDQRRTGRCRHRTRRPPAAHSRHAAPAPRPLPAGPRRPRAARHGERALRPRRRHRRGPGTGGRDRGPTTPGAFPWCRCGTWPAPWRSGRSATSTPTPGGPPWPPRPTVPGPCTGSVPTTR